MQEAGIAPHFVMRNLVKQAGSYQKVGFLEQDVKNFVKKVKKEAL